MRAEAYNARIVALLGAIERQVAALADPARRSQAEAEFLDRYRRQARRRHGFLTPPDFDRRRRVPVADIYVPTGISEGDDEAERVPRSPDPDWDLALTVWDLAGMLDRTVLLGDPGGGKTTAANVLTDRFAGDGSDQVAFLVTLREYAAKTPIEWSVAEHIEQNLKTLYQSPAPDGLVERLLLTGRAVVIFDGLDELLDTSRRRDVSDRVEQFCAAYPLAPVLVTSRVVGYDQARLDDAQFTCYRLGGFGDDEVAQYAAQVVLVRRRASPPAEAAAKAAAFLAESANATDLRANPLLLSLMCILYRGAGSLPGDRAGLYARCAELLLRKWDEQRDLYRKLGSDHLVEPTLRYLAWWLFTREDGQSAATERELIAKAAEFLYERGYETEEQARAAAREFVEFCRGRMWVFSDAGTTADGEKLYGFTHRTFLEYFAAWHLAVASESPEDLARTLAPNIAAGEWTTVAELAIKLKSEASDRGADRVYAALLDPALGFSGASPLLEFLAELLPTARPAPATVRSLTRALLGHAPLSVPGVYVDLRPLDSLLARGGNYRNVIAEEMSGHIARLVACGDARDRFGLRLAVAMLWPQTGFDEFWQGWAKEECRLYLKEITSVATGDRKFRVLALFAGALGPADALAMPGGLDVLATVTLNMRLTMTGPGYQHARRLVALMPSGVIAVAHGLVGTELMVMSDAGELNSWVTAIGQHLIAQPELPWVISSPERASDLERFGGNGDWEREDRPRELPDLEQDGNLGTAAVLCLAIELGGIKVADPSQDPDAITEPGHGSTRALARYIARRAGVEAGELPDLPVPAEFRHVFRDWAANRVNFVEVTEGQVIEIS